MSYTLFWGYSQTTYDYRTSSQLGARTSPSSWVNDNSGACGWLVSAPFLIGINPNTGDTLAIRGSLVSRLRAYPYSNYQLPADGWCTESANVRAALAEIGVRPATEAEDGVFYVAMFTEHYDVRGRRSTRDRLLLDEAGTGPKKFACYHCAQQAARQASAPLLAGNSYATLATAATSFEGYLPEADELAETGTLTSATVKTLDSELPDRGCSTCGRIGHNSRTCERPAKAHAKIGIEIEGRWVDLSMAERRARDAGMSGCGDGSVRGSDTASPWEFQTSPGSLAHALNQLVDLYPDEADSSCGMHVHVSFGAATDVTLLTTEEFFAYFRQRWIAWGERMGVRGRGTADTPQGGHRGEFWKRLFGCNSYCRVNGRVRGNPTSIDRYHQLNFSAYSEHETVECRLLPMFRHARLAVSAVQELIAIYEDYLNDPALALPSSDVVLPDFVETEEAVEVKYMDAPIDLVEAVTRELEVDEYTPPDPEMVRTFRGTVEAGVLMRNVIKDYLAA